MCNEHVDLGIHGYLVTWHLSDLVLVALNGYLLWEAVCLRTAALEGVIICRCFTCQFFPDAIFARADDRLLLHCLLSFPLVFALLSRGLFLVTTLVRFFHVLCHDSLPQDKRCRKICPLHTLAPLIHRITSCSDDNNGHWICSLTRLLIMVDCSRSHICAIAP